MDKLSQFFFKTWQVLGLTTFSRCRICGQVVSQENLQQGWCLTCIKRLRIRQGGYCPQCGAIYSNEQEDPYLCLECRKKKKPWDRYGFYQRYNGLLRDLILAFKFQGCLGYTNVLQYLLQSAYDYHLGGCLPDIIVPVPIGLKRLGYRGFNQCLELARGLSSYLKVENEFRALQRVREIRPQSGLGYKERWRNIAKSVIAYQEMVAGKKVLLVDDIYTTGSTLTTCTNALKNAGAVRVDVLVLARSS